MFRRNAWRDQNRQKMRRWAIDGWIDEVEGGLTGKTSENVPSIPRFLPGFSALEKPLGRHLRVRESKHKRRFFNRFEFFTIRAQGQNNPERFLSTKPA